MAVTSGTVHTVDTLDSLAGQVGTLNVARILFTMSGTYAQADDSILTGVAALISASRRNGKTITLVDCMCGSEAMSTTGTTLALKTPAISSADITFTLTTGGFSTEHADATAIPSQARPFSLLVSFTEA